MNRWKNYGLWLALGSLAVMFLNDAFKIAPSVTQPYIDIFLTILIAAGVVSNPTDGKGFKDGEQ